MMSSRPESPTRTPVKSSMTSTSRSKTPNGRSPSAPSGSRPNSKPGSQNGSPREDHGASPPRPMSPSNITGHEALEARHSRKKAEEDLQLLMNRIAILKAEEGKAMFKVNETKVRATEILEAKERRKERAELLVRLEAEREERVKINQAKAAVDREERQKKLMITKMQFSESKRMLGLQEKEEAKKCAELTVGHRANAEEQKKMKAEAVRVKKEQVRIQMERDKKQKEYEAHLQYIKKIEKETLKRQETEERIKALEQEEQAMIARLRKTKDMQKEAFKVLANTLEA